MNDDSGEWEQEYWPDAGDEEEEERRQQEEEEDDYWEDLLLDRQEEYDYLIEELYRQQEEEDWEDHFYRHDSSYRRQPYLRLPPYSYQSARKATRKIISGNIVLITLLMLFCSYILSII